MVKKIKTNIIKNKYKLGERVYHYLININYVEYFFIEAIGYTDDLNGSTQLLYFSTNIALINSGSCSYRESVLFRTNQEAAEYGKKILQERISQLEKENNKTIKQENKK